MNHKNHKNLVVTICHHPSKIKPFLNQFTSSGLEIAYLVNKILIFGGTILEGMIIGENEIELYRVTSHIPIIAEYDRSLLLCDCWLLDNGKFMRYENALNI